MGFRRSIELLVPAGLLLTLLSSSAAAQLAGPGFTGLINTPTPQSLAQGQMEIGFTWLGGSETYLYKTGLNRIYSGTLGLLPGLETTLRFTEVVGMVDPEAPGTAYNTDRLLSAKYQLPLAESLPTVAVGMQDIASANELTGFQMAHGSSQYGQSTLYAVIGKAAPQWSWSLGAGASAAFINGVFGGATYRLLPGVWGMAEFDSHRFNYGIRLTLFEPLYLQAARVGDHTWAFSSSYRLTL